MMTFKAPAANQIRSLAREPFFEINPLLDLNSRGREGSTLGAPCEHRRVTGAAEAEMIEPSRPHIPQLA
ncbi:MAG TPA: hypothetical protein VGJ94_09095 [Syntrophorhabdaceae bacterium]